MQWRPGFGNGVNPFICKISIDMDMDTDIAKGTNAQRRVFSGMNKLESMGDLVASLVYYRYTSHF